MHTDCQTHHNNYSQHYVVTYWQIVFAHENKILQVRLKWEGEIKRSQLQDEIYSGITKRQSAPNRPLS